ncbi:MAG: type IV pilin N-terminal domain-containing protein [Methanosarcina sp.]
MEGKKSKILFENCQCVSEVIGQVLMTAVVVISLTSIAITIFSSDVLDPPHTPHVDLEIYLENSIVYILHVGGEPLELEDLKIIFYNNSGIQANFTGLSKYLESDSPSNGVLTFGERLKIDAGVPIKANDSMEISLVHVPSQQVIFKSPI